MEAIWPRWCKPSDIHCNGDEDEDKHGSDVNDGVGDGCHGG